MEPIDSTSTFEMQEIFTGIRIPQVVVATDGTVLAFADSGRQFRRSEDGGKTWSPVQPIGNEASGNPIVDANTGDVLLVVSTRGQLWRSCDHGKTWACEEIVIKPNAVGQGSPDGVPISVSCSESGVTLQFGEHKGRLLMPGRIQPPNGDNAQEYWPYNYNTAMYSDDGGKNWQVGGPIQSGTGEGTLAEVSDGRVYYNSRCHMAVDHRRLISWSHDGGHMWTDWQASEHLYEIGEPFYFKYGTKPSYGCNAGLVRMPSEATDGKDVVLFSTPDNPGKTRVHMTVWASFDRCKTWPVKRMVYEGPSAYSSLSAGKDGMIYLLFESAKEKLYEDVTLAQFNLDWLTEGRDWRTFSTGE